MRGHIADHTTDVNGLVVFVTALFRFYCLSIHASIHPSLWQESTTQEADRSQRAVELLEQTLANSEQRFLQEQKELAQQRDEAAAELKRVRGRTSCSPHARASGICFRTHHAHAHAHAHIHVHALAHAHAHARIHVHAHAHARCSLTPAACAGRFRRTAC